MPVENYLLEGFGSQESKFRVDNNRTACYYRVDTNMSETIPSVERGTDNLVTFSIAKGLGDRTIRDHLVFFQKEGMVGSQAAHSLFSLFEPLPATEDNLDIIRLEGKKPETLWDQVAWVNTHPQSLTPIQKEALTALKYFAIESLTNSPSHKLHGEIREISKETAKIAESVFEAYGTHLQKVLDPENPLTAKILNTEKTIAKAAVIVSPLLLTVACGLAFNPKSSEAAYNRISDIHETPTNSAPATNTPEPRVGEFIPAINTNPIDIKVTDETGSQFPNFETTEEVLSFLESNDGANWINGDPRTEITYFPWKSQDTWTSFQKLKAIGNEPHFVFLVPNSKGDKFSLVGTETFYGNTLFDFVDASGNPQTILLKGHPDLKQLLGKDYDTLLNKSVMVWPDMYYPMGNCPSFIGNPVPGVTEGFACSADNTQGHYFQSPSKPR